MTFGKRKENVIRILPFGLRNTRPGKFLWKGHDAFYWRTRWFEIRIMRHMEDRNMRLAPNANRDRTGSMPDDECK